MPDLTHDGADPSDGTDPADRADRAGLDGLPVTVVRSHRNLGFAGGVNAGLSVALEAGATELAILNDDTTVAPDWITRLRRHLAGATGNSSASGADVAGDAAAAPVGAVQPKLLLDDGRASVGVTAPRRGGHRHRLRRARRRPPRPCRHDPLLHRRGGAVHA